MLSPGDARVQSFLGGSMIVELATLSPNRRPFVTPLWFVVHRGSIYIATGAETWAGKNVVQHPAVTLLFRAGASGRTDQVLRMRGAATCHRGFPSWPVLLRVAVKYYMGGLGAELRNAGRWRLRQRYYAQAKGGPGHIVVVPETCEFLTTPPAT
jgi:pyridoxamine 5'-phosphate oxidase-like protein